MAYAFVFWALLGGLETLGWYLAPRVVMFYKWKDQAWWNFQSDDLDTWPKQLGEFVDY